MSVQSVKYYDVLRVLANMASQNSHRPGAIHSARGNGTNFDSLVPDLSRHGTRLDRMREYSSALTSRLETRSNANTSFQPPQKLKPLKSPTPTIAKQSKQSKSMTTNVFCGPCGRDNFYHDAAGYCQECSEYFCETCIKHHKNLKITKNHTLRDRRNMPKVKHYVQEDDTVEICDQHLGELIRYYCKNHDEPCCTICATLNHRTCDGLVFIPEIEAKQTNKSSIIMTKHITSLTGQFEKAKEGTEKCLQSLDIHREDHQQKMLKIHQEIVDLLYKLETLASQNVDNLYEDERGFLLARIETCTHAIRSLQTASSNLDMAKKTGIDSKIFLQTKKLSKQVAHYEFLLADVTKKNNEPLTFTFKVDDKVKNFKTTTKVLGSIDIKKKPTRTTMPLTQFYVKSQGDAFPICDVTGTCVLEDGRIILADMYNQNIKVVDSHFHLITQTKLTTEPWDLCPISKDQIAVTLPRERKIQFFNVGSTLHPAKKIGNPQTQRGSQYYGIAYYQEKLYVTCPKDETPSIKVLNMLGEQLQQFASTNQEQSLFSDPLYITVTNDGGKLYVSDSGNMSIISIELSTGSDFTHQMPKGDPPGGLSVQANGDVYICGFKSNTLQVLSASGQFVEDIIDQDEGFCNPQSIAYSDSGRQLIVTLQKSDMVKVYQLT